MIFIRGMNERGQEGLTLTTLLLIILGVVAVVVIILFFTGFFSKVSNAAGQAPGQDLQAAVSACNLAGSSGLQADYCATFRKITVNGVEQYQTCESPAIQKLMDTNKLLQGGCGTNSIGAKDMQTYCQSEKLSKNTIVGNMYCSGVYTSADATSYASSSMYS